MDSSRCSSWSCGLYSDTAKKQEKNFAYTVIRWALRLAANRRRACWRGMRRGLPVGLRGYSGGDVWGFEHGALPGSVEGSVAGFVRGRRNSYSQLFMIQCARTREIIGKTGRKYSAWDEGDARYFPARGIDGVWGAPLGCSPSVHNLSLPAHHGCAKAKETQKSPAPEPDFFACLLLPG